MYSTTSKFRLGCSILLVELLFAIGVQSRGQTTSSDYKVFINRALELRDYKKTVPEDSLFWAISEAQKVNDYTGILRSRIVLGSQWVRNDQLDKGDSLFAQALKECEFLKGDERKISATILSELANIQYIKGNLDSTWVLQNMVYEVDKEFQDTFGMITVLQNIANAAHAMGKRNLAMQHLIQAIDLCREVNDSDKIAPIFNKIAFIYHNNDNYRMAIKNFKEAEDAITEKSEHIRLMNSLGMAEALSDSGNFELALKKAQSVLKPDLSPRNKAFAYAGLTTVYIMMGDTQKAIPYLMSNYEYGVESGIPFFIVDASLELGIIKYREGNYDKARSYLEETWKIIENYNMLSVKVTTAEYLAKVALAQNRTNEGISYLNTLVMLKDSFAEEKETEKLTEAQVKYETEKTEQENTFLNEKTAIQQSEIVRKNRLITAISALSGLLLLLLALFFWQRQSLKRKNVRLANQNLLISEQTEALKALDKQKNAFFANVSHELRTPLTLVLGPLEKLVTGDQQLSRATSGNLNLAYQGTQRLKELVEEILDVTRLNNDKLRLNLKTENFDRFIHRLYHAFESMAELKGQRFTLDYNCASELSLVMDRDKVEKIISNLVSNAFKFSPKDTTVQLSVSNDGGSYRIQVKDQGPGLNEQELDKIFKRNYQSDDGHQGGLGIGLWLSKELAQLMGGSLMAKNNNGDGAVFTFTFKARKSDAESPKTVIEDDSIELPELDLERKAHVLVVEDNEEMRRFVLDTLNPYFITYEAATGQEALDVLANRNIDLITSDVMMPELGGFELLSEVRANSEWGHIPFVMITARSDEESRLSALKEGVDDYVIKPFLSRELIVRIHNILKNYLLRRQTQETEGFKTADEQTSDVIEQAIDKHLKDERLSAERLSEITGMSERSLYRQVKSIYGLTPAQFIKEKRLSKARKILENEHRRTVAEVAYSVGYNNARTFSKHFFERFGKYPSDYLR